jgi:hypothetical protein
MAYIEEALARLRQHFEHWPCEPGKEWYLVNFAYYEGCGHRWQCCTNILQEAAPLALGRTLVDEFEFTWCMLQKHGLWRYSIRHPEIDETFDLYGLDENPLLDPNEHDDETEPFDPGEGAHESIHAILRKIGKSVSDSS